VSWQGTLLLSQQRLTREKRALSSKTLTQQKQAKRLVYVYSTFPLWIMTQRHADSLLTAAHVQLLRDRVTLSHDSERKRILNVSPVFAESVFLMTRHVFAESAFCWVRWIFAESVFVESVICWRGALLPSQFFAESVLLSQFLLTRRVIAESDLLITAASVCYKVDVRSRCLILLTDELPFTSYV